MQCLTDAYDAANPEHVKAKQDVELGNGLPGTRTTAEVNAAVKEAGLEVRRPPRRPHAHACMHARAHTSSCATGGPRVSHTDSIQAVLPVFAYKEGSSGGSTAGHRK